MKKKVPVYNYFAQCGLFCTTGSMFPVDPPITYLAGKNREKLFGKSCSQCLNNSCATGFVLLPSHPLHVAVTAKSFGRYPIIF